MLKPVPVLAASALALLLAACDGNDIGPPDPVPQPEETQSGEEVPVVPAEAVVDPAPDSTATLDTETLATVTEEAEERAAEIVNEVTAPTENDTVDALGEISGLAPDPAPLEVADPVSTAAGTLPPLDSLELDTVAAANATGGPDYLGVWATRGPDCELVDQAGFSDFAVISSETLRIDDTLCTIEPGLLEGGTATVPAQCTVSGADVPANFTVSLDSAGELTVTEPSLGVSGRFVECAVP